MSHWLDLIWGLVSTPFIAVFIGLLAALTVFHHHKLTVVVVGFPILATIFVAGHDWDWGALAHHFSHHDEYHLLYNLALLLPGFSLVAYYFEHSGFDARLSKYIDSDGTMLWMIFFLSIGLDNIAAAMIGVVLLRARYGKENTPFNMLVGVVGASNLGGAGSFIGDTTTVMLYIAGIPITTLAMAFAATIPAQIALVWWAQRHGAEPLPTKKGRPTPVKWSLFLPLLGIPGLVVGNVLADQPGLGLWAGLLLGCVLGRVHFRWQEVNPAGDGMKGMYFLVVLVGCAGMIPTDAFRPILAEMSTGQMAYALGVLSAFFDNIPLTKLAIVLGGFYWGELAYAVGFGGSAMWFGSSAGVAVGAKFPEFCNTKRWFAGPFWAMQVIYAIGFGSYTLIWGWAAPSLDGIWTYLTIAAGLPVAFGAFFAGTILLNLITARLGFRFLPGIRATRTWLTEARAEWH